MTALYISSLKEKAGKTMLAAGLGRVWADRGKKVGYFKLLPGNGRSPADYPDRDTLFMQKILGLKESPETLCPVVENQEDTDSIKQMFDKAALDKDIVIIEGIPLNASSDIIKALEARVLVLQDYASPISGLPAQYRKHNENLLGIIVNKVPRNKVSQMRERYRGAPELAEEIEFLGLIPEKRILAAPSVFDLAEAVQGKILNNPEKATELIENFMMGSSTFDRGAAYYSRKANKAVILWGERPGFRKAALANLQLAALQTSTRCIVISAEGVPIPAVAQKAEENQVPLISAPGTVPELATVLENALRRLKFNQENKLPELVKVLEQNLDLKTLTRRAGLAS